MLTLDDILDKAADAYADGKRPAALRYYAKAEALDKNCVEALEWLGELHVQDDKLKEAIRYYERAVRLNPKFCEYANLGYCYYELGKAEKAVDALSKALAMDAKDMVSHSNYGKALYDYFVNVDAEGARRLALRWRRDFPNSRDAQFMGAAISGKACPNVAEREFVRETFDDFADEFDKKLAELDYAAPKLLAELVTEFGHLDMKNLLDLGCGTGLLGIPLRSLFPKGRLWGVDLSSEMLKRARGRKLYSRLKCAEIVSWLGEQDSKVSFDIIAAADVFCYFGDLLPLVRGSAHLLDSGGLLLFSIELGEKRELRSGLPYGLHVSGRYRHSDGYAKELADSVGLDLLAVRRVVLRTEYGAPVFGNIVAMRKA